MSLYSSNETCDKESWEYICETFKSNNNGLLMQGFIDMYKRMAIEEDPKSILEELGKLFLFIKEMFWIDG